MSWSIGPVSSSRDPLHCAIIIDDFAGNTQCGHCLPVGIIPSSVGQAHVTATTVQHKGRLVR